MPGKMLFDDWPQRYDAWFETPLGKVIRQFEAELIGELLRPGPGDNVLDAGCGTGVFTLVLLAAGASVTGLDVSRPMLELARKKTSGGRFSAVQGDMLCLPFPDNRFDRSVSVTALEFIADARRVVNELFRVTRPGGRVVVATLNSLSSWAARRKTRPPDSEEDVWKSAIFRSPDELLALSPSPGFGRTAIHFEQDAGPCQAVEEERLGRSRRLGTGAFAAVCWEKG